ncbi:hypothetical protein J3R82DRAFT_2030 [Butyriboletus roseoflavus]|nr:hypothetical protein J3R82DRAFT_2030 [Butyriboletus roseoflavus]
MPSGFSASSGAAFGDTFIYESSRAPNSSQYEAFFLGSAEIRGTSFEPYTIYAGTNSDILSVNRVDSTTTHAELAGCNHTNSVPFSWNYTFPDTGPVGEHVDSAGGKTSFYLVSATTSGRHDGAVYHQTGTGLVQTYEAPGAAMLPNAPDLGGEQPPNHNAH